MHLLYSSNHTETLSSTLVYLLSDKRNSEMVKILEGQVALRRAGASSCDEIQINNS